MEPFITSGTLSQWTWALWGYWGKGARCPLEGQFLWFWRFLKKKNPRTKMDSSWHRGSICCVPSSINHGEKEKFQGEPAPLPTYRCPSVWLTRRRAIIQASHPWLSKDNKIFVEWKKNQDCKIKPHNCHQLRLWGTCCPPEQTGQQPLITTSPRTSHTLHQ